MTKFKKHTKPEGEALTQLIIEVFRVNGQLLSAGDLLTAPEGLTSSRWQVMGAIGDSALPVPEIAKYLELRRQSVQRIVDVLADEGLIEFKPNPNHKRAKLVSLTKTGLGKLKQVEDAQTQWAGKLAAEFELTELQQVTEVLQRLKIVLSQEQLLRCGHEASEL